MVAGGAVLVIAVFVGSYVMGQRTLINGITVPPEPDATLNNSTLAGMDVNNNGVRDDVERVIATKFGASTDYSLAMIYAKSYQAMVAGPKPADRNEALAQVSKQVCDLRTASQAVRGFSMNDLVANTPMRKQSLRAFNDVLVGYIHRELPPCAK